MVISRGGLETALLRSPAVGNATDCRPGLLPQGYTCVSRPGQASPGQLPASDWAQWGYSCRPVPARGGTPLTGDFGSRTPHQPSGNFHNTVLQCETLPPPHPSFLPSLLHRGQTAFHSESLPACSSSLSISFTGKPSDKCLSCLGICFLEDLDLDSYNSC